MSITPQPGQHAPQPGNAAAEPARRRSECWPQNCEHRYPATPEEVLAILEGRESPLTSTAIMRRVLRERGCTFPRTNTDVRDVSAALTTLTGREALLVSSSDPGEYERVFGGRPPEQTEDAAGDDTFWMLAPAGDTEEPNSEPASESGGEQ